MKPEVREAICDMGYDEAVLLDSFDGAVVGVTTDGRVVYDYDAMVQCLVDQDGMSEDEAIEFIEYNTVRSLPYVGEKAPIIMNLLRLD